MKDRHFRRKTLELEKSISAFDAQQVFGPLIVRADQRHEGRNRDTCWNDRKVITDFRGIKDTFGRNDSIIVEQPFRRIAQRLRQRIARLGRADAFYRFDALL